MKPIDRRRRRIVLIHVAKRELGMDDASYRATLRGLQLPSSTAHMTLPQLDAVLEHMKRSGFKVQAQAPQQTAAGPPVPDPKSQKIRALWRFLYQLGAVKDPSEAALVAYVKRMTRVDALQWSNDQQARRVIEALKKWAMRFLPLAVKALAQEVAALPLTDADRDRLKPVLHRAFTRGTFEPMRAAWELLIELQRRGPKP